MSVISAGAQRAVRPAGATILLLAGGPVFGVLLAVMAKSAGSIRTIVAAIALGILVPITLRWPQAGVVATLTFLSGIGLVRRLLIPVAGWSGSDPLLLVGPAVAVVLLVRRPQGNELRSIGGALPAMVAALLLLTGLEVFNPEGGGLLAGVTGLLFIAAPLLWFFVGVWLADDRLVAGLQATIVLVACLAAGYGVWQTLVGFPSWDTEWIRVGGYTALQVGVIRSFSFFTSSAEYAICLTAAIMVILARTMRGRLSTLPALPLLVWALILESSRTMVVQGLAGILIMAALLAGSVRRALVIAVVGLVIIGVLDQLLAPHLLAVADTTSDPLIAHEAGGLGDPLNPEQSTVQIHVDQVLTGFALALNHPLGLGTAGTNLAGLKVNELAVGAEVDIPNQFISLGILGGLLYVAIVVRTLAGVAGLALRRRDVVSIATVGILVVSFGQWLNGGYYALAPLVWLLIGSIGRSLWVASRSRPAGAPASSQRAVEGVA
jgi:hypothetical protein